MDFYSEYANVPAGTPPAGVVSNFDNPPSQALDLYIGMGICIAVTAIFLTLRLYAKLIVTHTLGWDDLACSIAFAIFVAHIVVTFTMTGPHGPIGTHEWDNKIGQYNKVFLQVRAVRSLATLVLYAAAAFFIKLSLFILYFRLFKPNKFTRWLVYGGIITCALFYPATIIGNCVIVMPTPGQPNDNSAWLLRANKSAYRLLVLAIVQSVFGTLSDIYLLVTPIQMIFQLHFSLKHKIGVSAVFMMGILAIACSLANLVWRVRDIATTDHTWFAGPAYIFSAAELGAGMICSCMPICASLLRGRIPKNLQYPSVAQLHLKFRSRSSQRPLVLDQTHSLDSLQPHKRDSYLGARSKDSVQLENGSGLGEVNTSVLTQRERLEY